MKRALKPKPEFAIAPAMVSQLTSLALFGVDERRFLEQLVPLCKGDVTSLGRLRLVPVAVAVAKLRELATREQGSEPAAIANDVASAREPKSVDDVLAAIGRRRTGGARQ